MLSTGCGNRQSVDLSRKGQKNNPYTVELQMRRIFCVMYPTPFPPISPLTTSHCSFNKFSLAMVLVYAWECWELGISECQYPLQMWLATGISCKNYNQNISTNARLHSLSNVKIITGRSLTLEKAQKGLYLLRCCFYWMFPFMLVVCSNTNSKMYYG